jgi:transposase-like protein
MERRKFTREFKLEAVRLIKDRGVSYAPPRRTGSASRNRFPWRHRRMEMPGSKSDPRRFRGASPKASKRTPG